MEKESLNMNEIEKLPRFENLKAFKNYVKKEGFPDYMLIGNSIYTMENYDLEGKEVCYVSFDANERLRCTTGNRYGATKYEDLEVEAEDGLEYWRSGLRYLVSENITSNKILFNVSYIDRLCNNIPKSKCLSTLAEAFNYKDSVIEKYTKLKPTVNANFNIDAFNTEITIEKMEYTTLSTQKIGLGGVKWVNVIYLWCR